MTHLSGASAAAGRRMLFALLTASAWLSMGCARAAEAPLSLEEAMERAIADAPQLDASRAMVEAATQSASAAGRLPDPELLVGVDNLPVTSADRFSLNRDFMTMRRIGVMQTLPSGAARRGQAALAAREIELAEAQLQATRFDTARAVGEAWIASAVATEALRRLRALRAELAIQSEAARAALTSGRSNSAEALASAASLAGLDARILELEQRAATARVELARWIGDAALRTPEALPWQREAGLLADIGDVSTHAPLAPVTSGIAVANARVALARAGKRPDWSVELAYSMRGARYSDMVSMQFRVGLPLFARNRQNPAIAARLAEMHAQEAERETMLRMHRAELQTAQTMWQSGHARLAHFESVLLPLAQDRARTAVASYGAGRGELRDVLDALETQVELENDFTQLAGEVTRAWLFLHLLHAQGEAS
jgi:cobalt-zinc-cadmium efflux system outer membrane protein